MVTGNQRECHAVRQKPEEENGEKIKGIVEDGLSEKKVQLINLLPCNSQESSFPFVLSFLIDRIIENLRQKIYRKEYVIICMCFRTWDLCGLGVKLCIFVCSCVVVWASLCLGQASFLSAWGLDAAPHSLPIILFSLGFSLSHNLPPCWDEVITLHTLHYNCASLPKSSPIITPIITWGGELSLQFDMPVYCIIRHSCYKHYSIQIN